MHAKYQMMILVSFFPMIFFFFFERNVKHFSGRSHHIYMALAYDCVSHNITKY